VRDACLWLPEAEEFLSHGSPNFRVRGKTFATFVVNHHGDGRVALWLNAPPGAQETLVRSQPRHFFVPPYVGPRGWLGVRLDQGMAWGRVAALVREGYEIAAPAELRARIGKIPPLAAPRARRSAADLDPLQTPRARKAIETLRKICLALPEAKEVRQFGNPAWQAGRRTFAIARYDGERPTLCFWVGGLRQGLLTADPRYRIPPYFGHRGWIALGVETAVDRSEVQELALQSYRHFALKRMLLALSVRNER